MGYGVETRQWALTLYLEGMSFRAIARLFHITHQTVVNWVTAHAATVPIEVDDTTPTTDIEVDELFTFLGDKKKRSLS